MRLLTLARDLKRRKARERRELFVAEGLRVVEELHRSRLPVRGLLVSDTAISVPRVQPLHEGLASRGVPVEVVSEREFRSAAHTEHPQGVLAIAPVPERALASLELPDRFRLLALDAVQDPGNAGTLLRTAAALGTLATLALPGTVDLWNAKVVRSAMGAHFHHPPLSCTWDELGEFLRRHDAVLWGADAEGVPVAGLPAPRRLALAVGNEGGGLSPEAVRVCAQRVAIPMAPGAESLNVAVATGILLYELRP
ncbi:MAG TPA: RNA methyltransferase [Gemmatimonadaceae bacterium]|nr:RNA methyltransferase [Gemmatimonadaceae bacterium]